MDYDLHSHSTASDGTLSPAQLVALAVDSRLQCLALTDHDTVAGLAEADRCSVSAGLKLIPGVEISVTWNAQTVHILGLNIDYRSPQLLQGLQELQAFRSWRAEEIGRRLARCGYPDAYQQARALSNGLLISRTHFARYLIDKGAARNMADVFRRFLVKNKPGHVSGDWASLQQAVGWIRQAGGIAVIAHPARYRLSAARLAALIEEFRDCGGIGFEVVSGSHTDKENHKMAQYARRYELYASAGSDFHGANSPWRRLGQIPALPDSVVPVWEAESWPVAVSSP